MSDLGEDTPQGERKCCLCGATDESVSWGPDPYASEIDGDETPMWLCTSCAECRANDI